jgi:hypothetical protein
MPVALHLQAARHLAVDGQRGARAATHLVARQRHQAGPRGGRRRLQARQIEQRRVHVHHLDVGLDDAAGGNTPGRADDQRHVHQLLVDGVAVADAAVLVELIAVIGHDDHRRLVVDPQRLEVGDEGRERGVAL